jgi:hypothetical protein
MLAQVPDPAAAGGSGSASVFPGVLCCGMTPMRHTGNEAPIVAHWLACAGSVMMMKMMMMMIHRCVPCPAATHPTQLKSHVLTYHVAELLA